MTKQGEPAAPRRTAAQGRRAIAQPAADFLSAPRRKRGGDAQPAGPYGTLRGYTVELIVADTPADVRTRAQCVNMRVEK
jgi:hypothetical protein